MLRVISTKLEAVHVILILVDRGMAIDPAPHPERILATIIS